MQEKIKEIAARIKELREVCEISVADMADFLTLSSEDYQAYESGDSDIPASMLCEIAAKLNVDMSVLLTGGEPHMHIFTVNRKGLGVSVERTKDYKYQSLAANFAHKRMEPFIVEIAPRGAGQELHLNTHPGQEFNLVLEGEMKVYIHGNEIVLQEGDSVYFDSKYEHAMEALGDKPAKFLAIVV